MRQSLSENKMLLLRLSNFSNIALIDIIIVFILTYLLFFRFRWYLNNGKIFLKYIFYLLSFGLIFNFTFEFFKLTSFFWKILGKFTESESNIWPKNLKPNKRKKNSVKNYQPMKIIWKVWQKIFRKYLNFKANIILKKK